MALNCIDCPGARIAEGGEILGTGAGSNPPALHPEIHDIPIRRTMNTNAPTSACFNLPPCGFTKLVSCWQKGAGLAHTPATYSPDGMQKFPAALVFRYAAWRTIDLLGR